jgi:hypothetical protein
VAVLKLSLDHVDLAGTVKVRCGCVETEFEVRVCLGVSVCTELVRCVRECLPGCMWVYWGCLCECTQVYCGCLLECTWVYWECLLECFD